MNRLFGGAMVLLSLLGDRQASAEDAPQAAPLYVMMVSHFDRPWVMCIDDLKAFEQLTKKHPRMRWTHLFNPAAYTQPTPLRREMEEFVIRTRSQNAAEIGVHLHMYESLVEAAGVKFRTSPSVNARSADGSSDATGYSVPMSSYTRDEIRKLLTFSIEKFHSRDLGRPKTFCPGYYTTSLDLQKEVAAQGFTTSAAAFPPGTEIGAEYPPAWRDLSGWDESLKVDSLPYRVSQRSILPAGEPPYITASDGNPLVELPQTCKIDWMVTAENMKVIFQKHIAIARAGRPTALCLAIHEMDATENAAKYDEVLSYIDDHLSDPRQPVPIRYCTTSEVRAELLKVWAK